jgi:hypothetical protein
LVGFVRPEGAGRCDCMRKRVVHAGNYSRLLGMTYIKEDHWFINGQYVRLFSRVVGGRGVNCFTAVCFAKKRPLKTCTNA